MVRTPLRIWLAVLLDPLVSTLYAFACAILYIHSMDCIHCVDDLSRFGFIADSLDPHNKLVALVIRVFQQGGVAVNLREHLR